MSPLIRSARALVVASVPALWLACGGALPGTLEADDLAAEPIVLPATAEAEARYGKADGYRLYPLTSVRIPDSVGNTETRKVFTTAAAFQRYFGVAAPVDFARRWVVFYSAGRKRTGGYAASVPLVMRSQSGRVLEVNTRLDSPGEGCLVTQATTKPMVLASFTKPSPVPGTVRYYRSDRKPASCISTGTLCGEALKTQLASASNGLLWTSESDYPFTVFEREGEGTAPVTAARLLLWLGRPASTQVEIRTLADMFDWPAREDADASPEERATSARYRALRTLLTDSLRDVTVIKLGTIQVEVFFLGTTRCGDVAGLQTLSIET